MPPPRLTTELRLQQPTPRCDAQLLCRRSTYTYARASKDREDVLYAKTNLADFIFEVERYTTLRMIPIDTHYYRNRLLDMLPSAAYQRT